MLRNALSRLMLFGFLALPVILRAQDLHYSQFYLNPMHQNPAQTGLFEGQLRAAAHYRRQWSAVPVDYRTLSGSFEYKALRVLRSAQLSLGGQIQHDEAGDAALRWTQVGLTGAVQQPLSETQGLSLGFGLSFAQRSVDLGKLTFGNQWSGELFDPAMPSKESLKRSSGVVPTLGAGLAWQWQSRETRARLGAGIGVFHLNRPRVLFRDDEGGYQLPMRYALSVQGAWPVGERLDVVAFGLGQQMGTAREIVGGAGVRRLVSQTPGRNLAIQFAVSSRVNDAVIPALQVEYNDWTVGFSYDVNTSGFREATNGRGGPEIAVIYRPIGVPPVRTIKVCPIF